MQTEYLNHPSEEALERFLLQRAADGECEVIETHILACESCVTRLEALELELTDLKTALIAAEQERIQKELNPAVSPWKRWFTIPTLSWAGAACAALVIGLTVVPSYLQHKLPASAPTSAIAEGDLSACSSSDSSSNTLSSCRGSETATLPGGHPLDLHLDTSDIPQGPVDIQVVDGAGTQIWQGQMMVMGDRGDVRLPRISQSGPYFLRFYAPSAGAERELLREYRFEVK